LTHLSEANLRDRAFDKEEPAPNATENRLLANVRAAFQAGDDEHRIATTAASLGAAERFLSASERYRVVLAIRRDEAIRELASARDGEDASVATAYWEAVHAGCSLSSDLMAAARLARTRLVAERSLTVDPSNHDADRSSAPPRLPDPSAGVAEGPDTATVSLPSATEPALRDAQVTLFQRLQAARQEAADALAAALAGADNDEIAAAAAAARRVGATSADPRIQWNVVFPIERSVLACRALRDAVDDQADTEVIAQAWARASARCTEPIDPALDAAGRGAFELWGRKLSAQSLGGGRS
jgi:hypothetical protein